MTFGERLTQLRKEHGYSTRNEFADFLGIPNTTLRNYETDAREPGHSFLIKMSELFDVSVDYLLGVTEERERKLPYDLKTSEIERIKKYRSLDSYGKETIDYILDREVGRVNALAERENVKQESKSPFRMPQAPALRLIQYFQRLASAGTGQIVLDDIPVDTLTIADIPKYRKVKYAIGVHGHSMEPDYKDGDIVLIAPDEEVSVGEIGIFMDRSDAFIKKRGKNSLISLNPEYKDIPLTNDTRCCGLVIDKYQPALDEKDIAALEEAHDILFGGEFLEKLLG